MGYSIFDEPDNQAAFDNLVRDNTRFFVEYPTISKGSKQAELTLADLLGKGRASYSDDAVMRAFGTLAAQLMAANGYLDEDGQLTFQAMPDGSARIVRQGDR